jgi:hypothetical protein
MRQPVSILIAAAMISVTALAIAPARATPVHMALPVAAGASAENEVVKVDHRYRQYRHQRRQHSYRRHQRPPFFFGFPFAFAPHYYQQQPYYRDCFRTFDGRVYCRR